MGWISPTGYEDPDNAWYTPTYAYDKNTSTKAWTYMPNAGWGKFLNLTLAEPITSNKIKCFLWGISDYTDKVDVDVYNSVTDTWVNVYEGSTTKGNWVEYPFSVITISKARIRFYYEGEEEVLYAYIFEVELFETLIHTITITESLGMVDSTTKQFSAKKTITDKLGITESVTKHFDARKTITDKIGMVDSQVPKWDAHITISDKLGMTDTVTRQKSMFQTISDILNLTDSTTNKGTFKQAITDILGMLDTATRGFPLAVTITDILGIRDRLITKKSRYPLPDLPDYTIRGGAPQ